MKFCALLVGLLLGIGIVHPALAVTRIWDDTGGSLGEFFSNSREYEIRASGS